MDKGGTQAAMRRLRLSGMGKGMEKGMENREEIYDLIVIGSGPGGYAGAIKAKKLGMTVAVVEKGALGGAYVGCGIPAKALLHSALLYEEMRESGRFGLSAESVFMDFKRTKDYRKRAEDAYREKIAGWFRGLDIPVFYGTAQIKEGCRVRVKKAGEPQGKDQQREPGKLQEKDLQRETGERELCGRRILLACGARPALLDAQMMALPGVETSDSLMEAEDWDFSRIVIIGGGLVGTEFATVFHAMGMDVTILERADYLLPGMDEEIGRYMQRSMEEKGIKVYTGAGSSRVEIRDGSLYCTYRSRGKEKELCTERVLVAMGRRAQLEGLFAPELRDRLETNNGAPVVGSDFQTSLPGVYAVGDMLQRTQRAHTAAAQATYLAESLAGRQPSLLLSSVPAGMYLNLPIIPSCVHTNPEAASVGLTEAQARRAGCQIRCGVYSMEDNSQAIITERRGGLIKLVFALPGKILIGAQIICPRATDMIGEMASAIANGLTARQLMLAMRAYPTYSEGIARAVEDSGLL